MDSDQFLKLVDDQTPQVIQGLVVSIISKGSGTSNTEFFPDYGYCDCSTVVIVVLFGLIVESTLTSNASIIAFRLASLSLVISSCPMR